MDSCRDGKRSSSPEGTAIHLDGKTSASDTADLDLGLCQVSFVKLEALSIWWNPCPPFFHEEATFRFVVRGPITQPLVSAHTHFTSATLSRVGSNSAINSRNREVVPAHINSLNPILVSARDNWKCSPGP
jgi:hypothetical protein